MTGFPFTAYYVEGDSGYIVAFVEEYPNIVTQGKTIDEARRMVIECVQLMLAEGRDDFERRTRDRRLLLRETLDSGDVNVDA